LAGGDGFVPIDFDAAPFASGAYACDQPSPGACFQLALRGRRAAPAGGPLMRSVHESLGVFVGAATAVAPDVAEPIGLGVEPSDDNAKLAITVRDWWSAPPLGRRFGEAMW